MGLSLDKPTDFSRTIIFALFPPPPPRPPRPRKVLKKKFHALEINVTLINRRYYLATKFYEWNTVFFNMYKGREI